MLGKKFITVVFGSQRKYRCFGIASQSKSAALSLVYVSKAERKFRFVPSTLEWAIQESKIDSKKLRCEENEQC